MNIVPDILFATMLILILFGIIHLIFTLGRIYECTVAIREIDEKIDKETRELAKINNEIKSFQEKLQKGGEG